MKKILNIKEAIKISKKLKNEKKTVVLAGGCFDILHVGHIKFLENAKKQGDFLFVLLESDKNVKRIKGKNRPINNQQDRATVLSSLEKVDYIIILPEIKESKDYDFIVEKIKPDIIAATHKDPSDIHKKRQAKKINAKFIYVLKRIPKKSTSNILKLI